MFISILIPTYNRSKVLLKNLKLLTEQIKLINGNDLIEIIISNNHSPDDTDVLCKAFIKNESEIVIQYYNQTENIGLEKNALFVLGKAKGDFVMYLGDDDFIEFEYLNKSIHHLKNNFNTSVIIPNFFPIDLNGNKIAPGRDDGCSNKLFKAGFRNCFINSWRGHQLSGLILKREGLLDVYLNNNVSNIYLFIYFVSYSCIKGDTFHFTSYPVKVTQPGQNNKNWGYGNDGLLNEVFDNFIKLPLNYFQKSILELKFFKIQFWRLTMYWNKGFKEFISVFFNIMFVKNGTIIFRIIFPFLAVYSMIKHLIRKKSDGIF